MFRFHVFVWVLNTVFFVQSTTVNRHRYFLGFLHLVKVCFESVWTFVAVWMWCDVMRSAIGWSLSYWNTIVYITHDSRLTKITDYIVKYMSICIYEYVLFIYVVHDLTFCPIDGFMKWSKIWCTHSASLFWNSWIGGNWIKIRKPNIDAH